MRSQRIPWRPSPGPPLADFVQFNGLLSFGGQDHPRGSGRWVGAGNRRSGSTSDWSRSAGRCFARVVSGDDRKLGADDHRVLSFWFRTSCSPVCDDAPATLSCDLRECSILLRRAMRPCLIFSCEARQASPQLLSAPGAGPRPKKSGRGPFPGTRFDAYGAGLVAAEEQY